MPEFKVRYKGGRSHVITADKYGAHGDFFVFTRDAKDIFSVALKEVESVGLADIPDPEHPEPFVA